MRINVKLWQHQIQMADFIEARFKADTPIEVGEGWNTASVEPGYAWLLAGCGTGKTLVAYEVMRRMLVNKVLVLTTKAAAIQAWLGDAEHLTGAAVFAPVGKTKQLKLDTLIDAEIANRRGYMVVYVMNYESAWRIRDELQDFKFHMVVADEGHRLKTHNSKQSVHLTKLCSTIPYRLDMTGTGWDDKPTDVYGQVRWLHPQIHRGRPRSPLLGSWSKFFDKYVVYHQHENIKIIKGYKNQDELRSIIDPFTMYVSSEDVLDLPEELHIERHLSMPSRQASIYRQMKKDMLVELEDHLVYAAGSKLEVALRLHQITSGYMPTEEGGTEQIIPVADNPKLQETLSVLEELDGQPAVIFTRFTHDVDILLEELSDRGYECKQLTGRKHEHIEWSNGDGQVLISNIRAGSAGVNLTRARYVIYYSIGHSRTDYTQSLARVRRPGADLTKPVTYFHLLVNDSIDLEIRKAMISKGEVADYLLKGLRNRVN